MSNPRYRIFALEDAPDVQLIIQVTLSDFDVVMAGSLKEAEPLLARETFDLYLLDVGLPDGDSLNLCESIRRQNNNEHTPILFLSGRTAEADRLSGFNRGADDYIVKPFSALELKARIKAKLRLSGKAVANHVIAYPPLFIDLERRKVYLERKGVRTTLRLTKIEFNLLAFLAKRPEVVRTRQELLDEVWGEQVAVTDRTVDVHIYKLRKKLGAFGNMIEANRGNGYTFLPSALPQAA